MSSKKYKVPAIAAPIGTNPYAKTIGKKIRRIREGRKLSVEEAATQLGIQPGHLANVEMGRTIPGPRLSERLYNWALCKVDYSDAGPVSESIWEAEIKKSAWRTLDVLLPPKTHKRFRYECERLRMSGPVLALLAIERFLLSRPAFKTMEEAIKEVNRARIIQAFKEAPQLRDLLECELDVAIAEGVEYTPSKQWEATKPAVKRLAEIVVDSDTGSVRALMGDDPVEDITEV